MAKARSKVDPEQIRSLHSKMMEAVAAQPILDRLYDRLLSIGGQAVAPRYEEDADKLLDRGQVMDPRGLKMMKGDNCACHANTSRLYESNPIQIATGYGLSEDQVWRQHTWGVWNGKIVETTVRRKAYFGFILSPAESDDFCYNNP